MLTGCLEEAFNAKYLIKAIDFVLLEQRMKPHWEKNLRHECCSAYAWP